MTALATLGETPSGFPPIRLNFAALRSSPSMHDLRSLRSRLQQLLKSFSILHAPKKDLKQIEEIILNILRQATLYSAATVVLCERSEHKTSLTRRASNILRE